MLKFSSCLLALILCSSSAFAITSCDDLPTCESLGYSKSEVANCKEYLSCLWDASYKKCLAISDDTCSTGQLSVTCGTEIGYSKTKVATSSNGNDCYECKCSAPEECKWTDSNKGSGGIISNKCCDGKYQTCTPICKSVTVPANAHVTATCTGCGTTVNIAWACNEGYVRNSDGTGCTFDMSATITKDCCKLNKKYSCDDGCSDTDTGKNCQKLTALNCQTIDNITHDCCDDGYYYKCSDNTCTNDPYQRCTSCQY